MRKSLRLAAQLATYAGIIFATGIILAPLAQAQHFAGHFEPHSEPHFEPHSEPHFEPRSEPHFEPRSEPHFEPHAAFGPHMRFDDRFHHDHFYPALGFAMAALPLGYLTVHGYDGDYYFQGGAWYRHSGLNYVVVEPPIGAVVPVLPPAYTTVLAGGVPYYYANDVYYAAAPGGYAVVQPPADASATSPAQASNTPGAAGSWYYCDSAKNYYPYVSQCAEGWRSVPATPPHPG